ncbi:serine/threonine-protein kinase SRPK3 [Xylariaceae sp. AK1471]|nr:serine/threonine-protein kinase SRPK3 [Xylariaceae sp. AK1471]
MSAPPTPPSEMPSYEDSRFIPMSTPCESADSYRPGGFHPVHFGDILHDRYRVIRKLGYGSYATVWLAEDSILSAYVALKIHAANVNISNELSIQLHLIANSSHNPYSNFVLLLSDSFMLRGPNGEHPCFVTKPMGPSISAVLHAPHEFYDPLNPPTHRFPTPRNKSFLRNILSGLSFLHSNSIIHGDLQLGNMLFALQNLTGIDPDRLEQNETNSKLDPLSRVDGKVDRWAPRYLAVPAPLKEEALPQEQQIVRLADFGGAFWIDKPPESIVTPLALRAPEAILHGKVGPAIDIWSFGCLMFELLTDYPLFEPCPFGRQKDVVDDEHLIELSEVVGTLPEDMLAKWPRYSAYFGPDGERLTVRPADFDESEMGRAIKKRAQSGDRKLPAPWATLEAKFSLYKANDIDDVEAKEIMSLLRDILQIDPLKRPSAAELLSRSWFST